MNVWLQIAVGFVAMGVVMSLLWLYQARRGDAGVVDVAWGMGVGLLTVFFAASASQGDVTRRLLIATLAMVWSLRLSGYIFRRLQRLPEDGRYQTLKESWGSRAQVRLFGFYQIQAFWSVLFALPMLIASRNPEPAMQWYDYVGIGIWAIALIGESIADLQLSRFRNDPTTPGKVCRDGLWRYSRHPNYFFEWIHWWAYVAFAVGAPWGWLTLFGPAFMLFFLLKVTGVPPTEAQAVKSRGDAYREYQRTTSVFFPWPPNEGTPA